MSDLISREAVIDAIFSEPLYESGMKKRDADVVVPAIYEKIRQLPSAQPERNIGKWIVVKRHEHYPSGKPYEQVQCPFCKRFDNNGDGSFCGYCGAEMQKGENDG